jgi:hypothetical protein
MITAPTPAFRVGGGVGLLDGRAQRDGAGRWGQDVGHAVDVECCRDAALFQSFDA